MGDIAKSLCTFLGNIFEETHYASQPAPEDILNIIWLHIDAMERCLTEDGVKTGGTSEAAIIEMLKFSVIRGKM